MDTKPELEGGEPCVVELYNVRSLAQQGHASDNVYLQNGLFHRVKAVVSVIAAAGGQRSKRGSDRRVGCGDKVKTHGWAVILATGRPDDSDQQD